MQGESGFDSILDLVRDLRVRCEFDRAFTLDTLRPYLREELAEFLGRTPHAATEYLSQCRARFKPYIESCHDE